MQELSEVYLTGFNSGYLLVQYAPELLARLTKGNKEELEFIKEMAAGKKEYEREGAYSKFINIEKVRW